MLCVAVAVAALAAAGCGHGKRGGGGRQDWWAALALWIWEGLETPLAQAQAPSLKCPTHGEP